MEETKEQKNKAKAERLIAWFENANLPPVPFKQNSYTTILGFEKLIEVATARLRHNVSTSEVFLASYFNLYYLKKDLIKLNELKK